MGLLIDTYYEKVRDYLHPNIHTFINHYKDGHLINLPIYHGCDKVNRNGTRKLIRYEIGEQCIKPTDKPYWKSQKVNIGIVYLTFTNQRFLFKNKDNLVYNYKLKKFQHMAETPMCNDWKYLQKAKEINLNVQK